MSNKDNIKYNGISIPYYRKSNKTRKHKRRCVRCTHSQIIGKPHKRQLHCKMFNYHVEILGKCGLYDEVVL